MSEYDYGKHNRMGLYFGGAFGLTLTLAFWIWASVLLIVPGAISAGMIMIAMAQTNIRRRALNDKIHAYRQIE